MFWEKAWAGCPELVIKLVDDAQAMAGEGEVLQE
jgi:hypothetical protein